MPRLPYQRLLYKTLQEYNTYELKSRGIGVTTFFLIYLKVKDRRIVLLGTSKNNGHDCSSNYTSALVSKATGQETNLKKANQQKPISVTFMLILLFFTILFRKIAGQIFLI